MRIYRTNDFAIGLAFVIFAVVCQLLMAFQGFDLLYCLASLVLIALAFLRLMKSFSPADKEKYLARRLVEKDDYVILKSSYKVMQIFCVVLHVVIFALLVCYWITNWLTVLISALTLCGVSVVLFGLIVAVNGHYEEH